MAATIVAKSYGAVGSATSAVAQKKAITNSLKAQAQDAAVAKKALVVDASEAELFTDDISGEVYKAYPVVLTESDFTASSSTISAETTVLSYQVPNGVEFLFRAPTSNLDRNSPYLYGTFAITNSTVHLNGNVRMKVLDASQNDLKGQPFTGAASQINAGDAIDWNKRLFFNCRSPIRAKAGDFIIITLKSTTQWATTSTITIQALQLVKQ